MMNQDALLQTLFGIIAALLSLLGIWVTWRVTRGIMRHDFSLIATSLTALRKEAGTPAP